jgi:two-component system sensor histidine kinase DctS
MKIKNIKIQWKIFILAFGIVLFSLILGGIILLGTIVQVQEEEIEHRLLLTARTVAELPEIKRYIALDDKALVNEVANRIRIIHNVTYIVVLDMNKVRLSDPSLSRVGKKLTGEDIEPAFAEHSYASRVRGELGPAIRIFVPIMNERNEQIGVVMAGQVLPGFFSLFDYLSHYALVLIFLIFFGIWGSWLLARHIKQQMFNLEPHEIARIYIERTSAFDAINEGIIAINKDEKITIFNEKAKEIFGVPHNVIGERIQDIIPQTRLPEILTTEKSYYNQDLHIGKAHIWTSRIPIKINHKIVGAIAIFRDRTELAKMAEELTGVKAFVDALRVQNHEFMNKLHTIAGLIQLDQKENALNYVFEEAESKHEITQFLRSNIGNDSLSGLLLSKISKGKEQGIEIDLDRRSYFKKLPSHMDHHDFVSVLGNLIENAFESYEKIRDEREKKIYISIEQNEDIVSILVEDNGIGIPDHLANSIFEKGVTTKPSGKGGYGLHIVKEIVKKGQGEIKFESIPCEGTTFMVTLPMKGD